MALIGARRFGAGDFGAPPISGVPLALGAQAVPALDYPPTEVPDVPIAPNKQGINWLGVLADALSGAAGQPGMYAHEMMRRRDDQTAFERGEQTWQSHHKQDLADQMRLLDYKRLHPDDELTNYMVAAGIDPASDAGKSLYRAKTEAMTAPPMMSAAGVDEQGNPVMRFFPRAQPVTSNAPPSQAVAYLKAHPEMKQQFEEKYGVGSASSYMGGPTQPASGGFPY